ncbi:MAG TPA: phage tail sheath subtilisin-like domain-containing protein [Roseiflexaceae bacterium]|nr:phage tail sheath subtilisin-like domain-containing protein [Roseiflexaceae bacterium]
MLSYKTPGVYIEEVEKGSKPIAAAPTAITAFVGFTEKCPVGKKGQPVLITNWTQYQDNFGGFIPDAYLPLSVYGYYLNGGNICYVVSLMSSDEAKAGAGNGAAAPVVRPVAQLPGKAATVTASLEAQSQVDGTVTLTVEDPTTAGDDLFKLTVRGPNDALEVYDNVTLNRGKNIANAIDKVNRESKLVKLKELDTASAVTDRRPANNTYTLTPAAAAALTTTGAPALTAGGEEFQGDVRKRVGIGGLEAVDEITLICAPDLMKAYQNKTISGDQLIALQKGLFEHCEKMKDRFAILDSPPDMSPEEILDWKSKTANLDTKYGALYYPWITVANPLAGKNGQPDMIDVPPSGFMAGLYARVDTERGVHKAPANEIVRGVVRLPIQVTNGEQFLLNPAGINCIRAFPGRGIRVWGARTLSSDASWQYINVRRLFIMVEESIYQGTQWVVFEPNSMDLWERVKRTVNAFLTNVWRSGALFGLSPDEAFYVKCDAELNPPSVRDSGYLIVEIGLAPVKPAEFVVFRFSQYSGIGE